MMGERMRLHGISVFYLLFWCLTKTDDDEEERNNLAWPK